jgi:transcriptional regulator with XRE-family HTH domain
VNRLKTYRKKGKRTQKQLAEAIGVSRKSISFWENGHGLPESGLVERLANFFNVPLDQFHRELEIYYAISILKKHGVNAKIIEQGN